MFNKETKAKAVRLYRSGVTNNRIMLECGIRSTRTLYRILAESGVAGKYRAHIDLSGAAAQWANSQTDISSAITALIEAHISETKIPYSQIEGGSGKRKISKQKSTIADSRVVPDSYDLWITYFDEDKQIIGKDTAHIAVPDADSRDAIIDTIDAIVRQLQQSHCQRARYTTWEFNILGLCHTIDL